MSTLKELWVEAGKSEKRNYKIRDRDFYLIIFSASASSLVSFFLNRVNWITTKPIFGTYLFNYILTALVLSIFIVAFFALSIYAGRLINKLISFKSLFWKRWKIPHRK